MVTAIVLIDVEADRITGARAGHRRPAGRRSGLFLCRDVDLVAITSTADHAAIADLVPHHISKVPGVIRTVTHIAFRSYSRSDAEDAFSIGMTS